MRPRYCGLVLKRLECKQDNQFTYNVTLIRVQVTIVTVEKQ